MSVKIDSNIIKFIPENPLARDNLSLDLTKWIMSNVKFWK